MQGRHVGWETAISLPAGRPFVTTRGNTVAIGASALFSLFFPLNEGNFVGEAKAIFQLDMCHGQGFFPQFCDIMENLANFSQKNKKLLEFILEILFIRKFPKFCLSKKDKKFQDKKNHCSWGAMANHCF
jgi:hypothetical protein